MLWQLENLQFGFKFVIYINLLQQYVQFNDILVHMYSDAVCGASLLSALSLSSLYIWLCTFNIECYCITGLLRTS